MHLGLDLLFLAPDQSGGRETYARELLGALRAERPGLRITTFVGQDAAGERGWWAEHADATVALRTSSTRSAVRWALGETLALPAAAAQRGVDLLHCVANFAPLTGPVPRVVTVHDVIFRRLPDTVPLAQRLGTEALVPPAARRAARVITVSAASRDDLVAELGLAREDVDVVPNGIAPAMPGDAAAARARLGAGDRAVVLCVAGNVAHKNLPALVEAVGRIDAPRRPLLVLAGHGTDAPSLAAEHVRGLGAVGAAELEDLYAAASAFATATRYEGFGLPVLEAMLRGVPVACSDLPVLREIAGDDARYFPPRDPEAITHALTGVLAGGAEVQARVRRGRERARRFTWSATAARTAEAYDRALSTARRRRSRGRG